LHRIAAGLAVAITLGFGAASVSAQAADVTEGGAGDTLGTYVVRPGDTLKGITARFLGDDSLWRENWRLNPNLRDPHLLIPGQELRIILDRKLPPRTVQVTMVARKVDQKPSPNPWTGAEIGDLLQEEDGLRTGKKASAEVVFDDETKLQLTEESLIFLRRIGATLRGVSQETVEIVEGQADLKARTSNPDEVEIEIIMGGTTVKPKPGPDGRAETRARKGAAGDSALMVYTGNSSVSADGAEVSVAKGMGTTVPAGGGGPTPPERLLPAARPLSPGADTDWQYSNLRFAWTPVRKAASYSVEICRDAECGALVERIVGLTDTEWTSTALPLGDFFWRVTPVAASGLDGYPSRPVLFSVLSNRQDVAPPVVVSVLLGNPSFGINGQAFVGDAAQVLVAARDDASGVASVEYRWNEEAWKPWKGERLSVPREIGPHRLETRATDRLNQTSESFVTLVERLGDPPQPPHVFATPSLNAEPPSRQEF